MKHDKCLGKLEFFMFSLQMENVFFAGTESGPGRGCSQMLWMGNFWIFWGGEEIIAVRVVLYDRLL